MARTQAVEYDERKDAIVETAAALFAREGYNGASVADIAKRGKISKSLIYHYYQSKDDILYDVMISHVRALETAAREATAGAEPPERKLRELTHRFMALYVGAADRHKVLLNDLGRLPKARRAEIVAVQRGLIEMVQKLLVEIEPTLKKKSGAAFSAAMLFFGTINWTHTWFDPRGPVSAGALAEMAVDLTLGGLRRAAE
ncbi:MAG TPA: TetR/AcrR family transcriptional regulator [Vitreimonas sp.]|uniref:TetR/AcrR family transcriptional regulator n=1 Tax=Vitreimonas sp. TaxID=3069702 RepID=UPI002D606584|nr:TetR/AcrR family transcriptional regulator [Vitreimonas sp.]HYD89517.1 TetR/AcrR family transcriptional regulator [Vitreimonas sp.]